MSDVLPHRDDTYEDLVLRCRESFRQLRQSESELCDEEFVESSEVTLPLYRRLRFFERRRLARYIAQEHGFGMRHEVMVTQRPINGHYNVTVTIFGGMA